jgi:hypothetical protein
MFDIYRVRIHNTRFTTTLISTTFPTSFLHATAPFFVGLGLAVLAVPVEEVVAVSK